MIGKLHGTVVDCKNPRNLARFYAELLGYVVVQSEAEWAVIGDSPDRPGIAFQFIENYKAPVWPSGEIPTQIHFDIRVEDFDVAVAAIESLNTSLDTSFASITSRKIITFHDAFGYFARAYGLEVVGVAVEAPGQDPSAQQIAELIDLITTTGVRAIFSEAQLPSKVLDQIAAETGATVLGSLYSDALGPAPADSYLGMMRANGAAIARALGGVAP